MMLKIVFHTNRTVGEFSVKEHGKLGGGSMCRPVRFEPRSFGGPYFNSNYEYGYDSLVGRRLGKDMRMKVSADDKLQDTKGVDSLLARDFKEIELNTDAFGDDKSDVDPPKEESIEDEDESNIETGGRSHAEASIEKKKERKMEKIVSSGGPRKSKEALNAGLKLFQESKYQDAVQMFQLALELPGSGVMRIAGSPKEISCPSEGEENAALYNMACAYCQMKPPKIEAAMTCLEAALDNGFEEIDNIRQDSDLQPLRGPQLEGLLRKYSGLGSFLTRKVKSKKFDSNDKPWLLW